MLVLGHRVNNWPMKWSRERQSWSSKAVHYTNILEKIVKMAIMKLTLKLRKENNKKQRVIRRVDVLPRILWQMIITWVLGS